MPQAASRARMMPHRRRLIDQLLDELLELHESARAERLAELRQRAPRISHWLDQLVSASVEPTGFLQTLFERAGAAVRGEQGEQAIALPPGARIGPWRLLASAGSGGMGTVYRAERADDGLAYLVMEWVEGDSLDQYIKRQPQELHQLLDLFVQIGEAVRHAHQRQVVHGDLKPSNIRINTGCYPGSIPNSGTTTRR